MSMDEKKQQAKRNKVEKSLKGSKAKKSIIANSNNVKIVRGKLKAYTPEQIHQHEVNALKAKSKRGNSRKRHRTANLGFGIYANE